MSESGLRLDKWLWHARFIKSRDLAAGLVGERRVRLNDQMVAKTHQLVRPGDVLTLRQGGQLRVLRVLDLGQRRGPAPEARLLYEELVSET
ncbi:MAG TPA: RNA-binding S4 domain-containing protein [Geminicoccaceae bacterium]|nr:RNA-binding S4 domain-containing protein [Geminicoccus sp.]HMU53257.1 RNA-binding S4 domain-containing protein [Geminicoccaceae bacterium]